MILVVSVQKQAWLNFKKDTKYHRLIFICLCVRTRVPAYGLRVCLCFVSTFLSMRGQQLVKCYQVDEKLQQIPFYNFMEKKADKIEWDGGELVSNVCLFICDLRRHWTPSGCAKLY